MRNVMFTDFDVSEEHQADLLSNDRFSYIVFQKEIAPSTGREHLQGYAELFVQTRFSLVKKQFGDGVHLEARKGSQKQAIKYCTKEASRCQEPKTSGEPKKQGKRSDLLSVRDAVMEGKTDLELYEDDTCFAPMLKYRGGIREFRNMLRMKDRQIAGKEVYVYWGAAGAGKTRKVWEDNPEENIFVKPAGKWFDGYHGQEVVLIDDFTGKDDLEMGMLLKILDRYPMSVPVKGSFTYWGAKKIYITSNLSPDEWYPLATVEQHAALRRRMTKLVKFSN